MDSVVIRAGTCLHGEPGGGRGRVSGLLVDKHGTLHAFTTSLICNEGLDVEASGRIVGRLIQSKQATARIKSADSVLALVELVRDLALATGYGLIPAICEVLSPIDALEKRVQVVRDPHQPSHGQIVGVGHAVHLINSLDKTEVIYLDALKIRPDPDGSLFSEGGDAGALLLTSDGEAVGVLLGTAEGHFYAASVCRFLKENELRFAGENDLSSYTPPEQKLVLEWIRAEVDRFFLELKGIVTDKDCKELGIRFGEEIARKQKAGASTHDLARLWPGLSLPVELKQPKSAEETKRARNFRLSRAHIVLGWRISMLQAKQETDDQRMANFRDQLGVDAGHWKRARQLLDSIQGELAATRAGKWFPSYSKHPGTLFIAYSGYHEERIIADIISMLSLLRDDPSRTFIKAYSPWAFGRLLNDSARGSLNRTQGGADIRLVNIAAGKPKQGELLAKDRPIFQHYGYSAYCHLSWLEEHLRDIRTPSVVQRWISEFKANSNQLISSESLPIRAWLVATGNPVKYADTEFERLFEYLWSCAQGVGPLPALPTELPQNPESDTIFQEFIAGRRDVFMGGSIHDVLIDDWMAVGDDIVKLLNPEDFQDLRVRTGGELGINAILFSPRVASRPGLVDSIVDLYASVWETLVFLLKDPSRGPGVLRYLREVLSPNIGGVGPWSFAVNDEAIIRLITSEVRPVARSQIAPIEE